MQGITERIPWSSWDSYEDHCPKNMSLDLADNARDVWMCECKRGFLYFPLNDSCYKAYRQGPCSSKNYLVLPENETVARCVENPCLEDGMVSYNGTCYLLETLGPCEPEKILDVDEITFQLKCSEDTMQRSFINTRTRNCPPGSRRSLKREVCRNVLTRHN